MRTLAYAKTRVIRSKAAQLRYVLHYALPAANANQTRVVYIGSPEF